MSFLFFCFTFYTNFLCVILIFLSVARYENYLNTSCRILSISFLKIFKVFLKIFLTLFFYLAFARSFIILTPLDLKVNTFSHVSFSINFSSAFSKVLRELNHLLYILFFPMELQYHYYLKINSLIY